MTAAELALWRELRCKRLDGFKFRRQAVILGYIADFWCPARNLVVEVDGSVHIGREDYDAKRDAAMRRHGLTVLRFTNSEVLNDIHSVLLRVRGHLG